MGNCAATWGEIAAGRVPGAHRGRQNQAASNGPSGGVTDGGNSGTERTGLPLSHHTLRCQRSGSCGSGKLAVEGLAGRRVKCQGAGDPKNPLRAVSDVSG